MGMPCLRLERPASQTLRPTEFQALVDRLCPRDDLPVAVGPAFTNRVHLWNAGELLVSAVGPRSLCSTSDRMIIIKAYCGPFVVTGPLQEAVAAGRRVFAGAWYTEPKAVGEGKPGVPRTLAVTFTQAAVSFSRDVDYKRNGLVVYQNEDEDEDLLTIYLTRKVDEVLGLR